MSRFVGSLAFKDFITVFFLKASKKSWMFRFSSGQVGWWCMFCARVWWRHVHSLGCLEDAALGAHVFKQGLWGISETKLRRWNPNGIVLIYQDTKRDHVSKPSYFWWVVPSSTRTFPDNAPFHFASFALVCRYGGTGVGPVRNGHQKLPVCPNVTPLSGIYPNVTELWSR